MRFFLDHDIPDVAGRVLAAAGHEVALLRELVATSTQLLGICFWREAPEAGVGPDRRAGKWGLIT